MFSLSFVLSGFSDGNSTWLPVNPNYLEGVNVEEEEDDPISHLNIHRTLVGLRGTPAVQRGVTVFPDAELADEHSFVFFRSGINKLRHQM